VNTINLMKEEIRESLKYSTLEEIEDRAGELIDSHLPIYNSEIIDEWRNMPAEYDDRGRAELGHMGEVTIIGLMTLDLYVMYSDLFSRAMQEIKQEEEANA